MEHQDGIAEMLKEQTGFLRDQNSLLEKLDGLVGSHDKAIRKIQTAMSRPGTGMPAVDFGHDHKAAEQFRRFIKSTEGRETSVDLRDYRETFNKYARHGTEMLLDKDRAILAEGKALSVGSQSDGGYWVTPQMADGLVQRIFDTSPIRQVASVTTIGTDALETVTDTNDAVTGGWVGEQQSRSTTASPKIGKLRIPVHEQFAFPEITQKLLDDAAFDVEMWLTEKIGDKLARTENTAFVTGTGVDQPHGFLASDRTAAATTQDDSARSWGVLQYVATGSAGAFDTGTVDGTASPADELIELVNKLKPAYRPGAVWLMSRNTFAEAQKLRDSQGAPIVGLRDLALGRPDSLLGFPVVLAEDMPALATDSFSIAFGNFRAGYQIVDRMGVSILRDPFTNKPFVGFYARKRVGGDVKDWDAIKLLKFSTS